MEAAVGAVAGKIAPKLLDFLQTNHKLRGELEHDIRYIKSEFVMICAAILQDEDRRRSSSADSGGGDHVQRAWIQMVRGLARDIEDCIDRFTRRVTLEAGAPWIRRKLHRFKTLKARGKFAAAIRDLRKTSAEASRLRESYQSSVGGGSSVLEPGPGAPAAEMETSLSAAGLPVAAVGMEGARDELMELMRETPQDQPREQLKVISLVGFGGIGKTLLARQAYDGAAESGYDARAWVRAGERGAVHVLKEILRQLQRDSSISIGALAGSTGSYCHLGKLRTSLRECLGTKRYFIVIDDVRTIFWHDIKEAFPAVSGVSSRVMVTTAIQSVANACSSAHGHVYVMKTLSQEHSRQLFFQEASLEDPPLASDGLPLALVTTAQFLQSKGDPRRWTSLCQNIGEHLETKETLARMKRVLVDSYTSLGSQDVKTCLLYMGIYPGGHPIRRGSLIRRWLAEGLIKDDHRRSAVSVAVDNFDELVDRSIIRPIDTSNSSSTEVKACQTHGMMIEFILHKSTCENFVTLLYDKAPLHSNIRWLSVHRKSAERARMNPKELRLVRSLTIFGKAHKSLLDFSKYELLRVLDLEECGNHLEDKHLKEICRKLLLLRYLSLRGAATITVCPKEIKKLRYLETLDVRRTKIDILPKEVMELPCLVHLFGRFKLEDVRWRMGKLQTSLSEKSKLETVSGFIVDKSQEFLQLMDKMEHLTRVKIWCESTAGTSSNLSRLSEAIKGFIKRGTDLKGSRSLSLNFNGQPQDLMNFSLEMDDYYYLSSLKLHNICSLPLFVTMLGGLTKLCLSSPDHKLCEDIFASLDRVCGLECVKLISTQLNKLVIRQGALASLRCLCIVVEVMTELKIQEGALPRLESLRLLCKDLNGFCGTTILSLERLKEVALHDGVSNETKHKWKEAAKNHPKRPKLLFVKTKLIGSEPVVETPAAPVTCTALSVKLDAICTGQRECPVQVFTSEMVDGVLCSDSKENGDSQRDGDGKEDMDNIDGLENTSRKDGLSTQVIDDQLIEDGTQSTDPNLAQNSDNGGGNARAKKVFDKDAVVDGHIRKSCTFGEGNSMERLLIG
ncbi:hypothetical protein QYE76_006976 [Lolium multiflorum]|uniref:Uncharacterized protein n=1 Tax=Lolium multiflorum TaxID=4521 RepID=A0AAD8RW10_LOLMU|nr:hypothetical protein QYE76_006976 [Lolium multiflorum]